jgi:hypothetical protein
VAADLTAIALMGFDERKLPKVWEAMNDMGLRVTGVHSSDDVEVVEVDAASFEARRRTVDALRSEESFVAHSGWRGHVERA